MGNGGAVAEPGRHRHVADRCPDAGQPCQASGERGADPREFGELHVVVGAAGNDPGKRTLKDVVMGAVESAFRFG